MEKHTTSVTDKYHDLSYYVSTIQEQKSYGKIGWLKQHFLDYEAVVELDNQNSIHAFSRLQEQGHGEQRYKNCRLIDLTQEELYTMTEAAILDDNEL